jgi:hypothetical protein
VAGFISEWWPASSRNGGRHHIGIPGRIASEFAAITRKRDERANTVSLFADFEAEQREASIDDLVEEQKALAKEKLLEMLSIAPDGMFFGVILDAMLEAFMLRETNVKDVCVDLAKKRKIENTWSEGGRKPTDRTMIKLAYT